MGRFISPDSTKYLDPGTVNGLNLYAYCLNNPVRYLDSNGCIPVDAIVNFVLDKFAEFFYSLGKGLSEIGGGFTNQANQLLTGGTYSGGSIYRVMPNGLAASYTALGNKLSTLGKISKSAGTVLKVAGYAFLAMDCWTVFSDIYNDPNLSKHDKHTIAIASIGTELCEFVMPIIASEIVILIATAFITNPPAGVLLGIGLFAAAATEVLFIVLNSKS